MISSRFPRHGPDATGATGLGPSLTDSVWLHNDGRLEGILNTVKSGVMSFKTSNSVMLPMGGSPLNEAWAAAAYVYSLSRRAGGSWHPAIALATRCARGRVFAHKSDDDARYGGDPGAAMVSVRYSREVSSHEGP